MQRVDTSMQSTDQSVDVRVAVQVSKRGHHLVYSTCTVNPGMHDLAVD